MENKITRFDQSLREMEVLFSVTIPSDFDNKSSDSTWSKKEILGHLIDSAINNIQRFTEIQFCEKPYQIRKYNPDELVKANDYQNKDVHELFQLWKQLNMHIRYIIENQTKNTLGYSIILPDNQKKDFRFLITDYINHLEHHLNQIIK